MCKTFYLTLFILHCCTTKVNDETGEDYDMIKSDERTLIINIDKNKRKEDDFVKLVSKNTIIDESKWVSAYHTYKVFCLDLGLCENFENEILKNLNEFFKSANYYFCRFLLFRCTEEISDDNFDIFYNFFNEKYYFDDMLNIEIDKCLNLSSKQEKRLKIIINEIFRNESDYQLQVITSFKNIKITINPINEEMFIAGDRHHIVEYIICGLPRIILCNLSRKHLELYANCFKVMLRSGVPSDVRSKHIYKYSEIINYCDYMGYNNMATFASIIYHDVYSDYHDFITKTFPIELERISIPVMIESDPETSDEMN